MAEGEDKQEGLDSSGIDESLNWLKGKTEIEIAKEIARLKKEVALGGIDELTGLRNRRGLMQELPHERALAQREGKQILVTIVDLDDLKKINDALGHPQGDELLKNTAKAITSSIRKIDITARFGEKGDEFLILSLVNNQSEGNLIEEKLRNNLKGISVSMGNSLWEENEDFEKAYKRADQELYKNKTQKKYG